MKFLARSMTIIVVIHLMIGSLARAQEASQSKTYTISGSVDLPGVMMEGLPGHPVTDASGNYSVTVPSDWSGEVTPIKEGYIFMPRRKGYMTLTRDRTNEDYVARRISIRISGSVATEGVIMKGLPSLPITGKDGRYQASVDYGWSGTVTPTKAGHTFDPPSLSYDRVVNDQRNQDYWPTRFGPVAMLGRSGGRKTLVIPVGDVNAEDLAEIQTDMQVMSHILDKRFKQKRPVQGLFDDFGPFFGQDNRQTEATYLQGYGILFSREVNFTFALPSTRAVQRTEKTTESVDSTWQQARQEVLQPGATESTEEQGPNLVEELKKDLITTLMHASNIRSLQPDEWIILTIIGVDRGFGVGMGMGGMMSGMGGGMMSGMGGGFGGGSSSRGGGGYGGGMSGGYGGGMAMGGMGSMQGRMSGMGGMGGGMGGMIGGMGMGGMGASGATVLAIRAKKSDVDAFAKGELDFEQFQEKVKTVMY